VSYVERLEWDSRHFSIPIGRINDGLPASQLNCAIREADAMGLACTYLLAPADDHLLIDTAQRLGFLVYDVRIELDRPTNDHPPALDTLRRARATDRDWLTSLAGKAFTTTRFFVDYHFPSHASSSLYVKWLTSALDDREASVVLVDASCSGFIACKLNRAESVGSIELIAVAPVAAGRGLGSALVCGAGALFKREGLASAHVVTQAQNVSAQRLYQRFGYRTRAVAIWLHRWRSNTERQSA
jgi:dTDP-4-amino-4,6-dideoxy-D-galactose acyltransferase